MSSCQLKNTCPKVLSRTQADVSQLAQYMAGVGLAPGAGGSRTQADVQLQQAWCPTCGKQASLEGFRFVQQPHSQQRQQCRR